MNKQKLVEYQKWIGWLVVILVLLQIISPAGQEFTFSFNNTEIINVSWMIASILLLGILAILTGKSK